MNKMIEILGQRLLGLRVPLIIVLVLVTVIFGYLCSQIKIYDDPNQWPPKYDPNCVINREIQKTFGGANVVTIQVTVKEGDIFNAITLGKVKNISDEILKMWGVVPYYLTSLSSFKLRYMKGTDEALDLLLLMRAVPANEEEMAMLKYGVYHNPTIYGPVVSLDSKSTIVIADFRTGLERQDEFGLPQTTPDDIYQKIEALCQTERDANHDIKATGVPIIIGWVNSAGPRYVLIAFLCFLVVIGIILGFAFKNVQGVVYPLVVGLIASVWGFGLQVLFFGKIMQSSSGLIAPFIIVAAASCHCV